MAACRRRCRSRRAVGRTLGILPDASGEKTGAPVSAAQGETGGGGSASGTLEVYFFDVGQGDSELIRLPGGENILIDAGTSSTEDELVGELRSLERRRSISLWRRIRMPIISAAWRRS